MREKAYKEKQFDCEPKLTGTGTGGVGEGKKVSKMRNSNIINLNMCTKYNKKVFFSNIIRKNKERENIK